MLGTQRFASATAFRRSHTLPPSEMKSLYGSITRSAVSCWLYVTFAIGGYDTRRVASRRLDDGVARYLGMSRTGDGVGRLREASSRHRAHLAASTNTMVQLIRRRGSGAIGGSSDAGRQSQGA